MSRPAPSESTATVSLAPVGFLVWAIGSTLMVWSFTSLTWYGADSPPTFRDLAHWLPDPPATNAAMFDIYFDWLAWTLFAVLGALCLLNSTRLRSRAVGVVGLVLGVVGAAVAVSAVHAEGARAAAAGSWAGLLADGRVGLWFAVTGSVIAGVGPSR